MNHLSVLMVTGAYHPEVSGAGLQCRHLIQALRDRVSFTVVATSTTPALPAEAVIEEVPVRRIFVDVTRRSSMVSAAFRLLRILVRLRRQCDIIHLHGFSRKSLLVIAFAKCFRKKLILKLTSAGHDDPLSVQARDRIAFRCYSKADLFIGVSPRLEALYRASGLPPESFRLIPNGIHLNQFRPPTPTERVALRRELGLPDGLALILFVGFFSHEKRPQALFEAWTHLQHDGLPKTGLLFVGAGRGPYYEIDPQLPREIQAWAKRLSLQQRVIFVERTHEVEKYYGAADVFALPSLREGLPNALLEAMASALPCVASRLPGITDTVIEDGANGLLVPPGAVGALAEALRRVLQEPSWARRMGRRARQTIEERYGIHEVAAQYLRAYQQVVDERPPKRMRRQGRDVRDCGHC